ncbi:bifunctional polysaccharide deacetylase/glycosyltransferase family 2 protein [Microbacterium terrisoli]|uniref:bifunctional polysaccharide deacetylase/glycosyltransferase family 2 protein n=1 Tax=Microbacterium terrisoli TaxID=3242192 RepID=UPI002803F004|nr:bifunctional polysaccharide deacetylase/glycosyltransferase family 2 protein [Microbacterium protaetiae]
MTSQRRHRAHAHAAHRRTRAHWIVLAGVLLVIAAALALQGYLHHHGGVTDDGVVSASGAGVVPAAVAHGGPVIDARAGQVATSGPKSGTIALTFDDGPDPTWTPKILDVLRRHGVHATFFVVGSEVLEHPDLVRTIVADGNEIGIHTLTHTDLGQVPNWQRTAELQGAQQAVIAATGRTTSLLRPPYSSTNDAVTPASWSAIESAAADGYLTVLSTLDSEDWQRPGVSAIEAKLRKGGAHGAVVLMHDGGGDRSETVSALDAMLSTWAHEGRRVTTVSDAVGISDTMRPATVVDRVTSGAFLSAVRVSEVLVGVLAWALLISGVIMLVRVVLVMTTAVHHARAARRTRRQPRRRRPDAAAREPVTVIVPAYNEAAGIEAAVRSIAASTHPVQIIVVDDGSTDDTAARVEALGLSQVSVIRQRNAGKPAALNAGLRAAGHELVVMVDGDTVFEPETVERLIRPFDVPAVGAVSGNTKVANRRGVLGGWQHIEYVVGFNLDRRMFDVAQCMPTVPGAIGAFRRSALAQVGGVSGDTLAEDTDLTMALARADWRIVYEDDARAWTEAPQTLGALWRQRYRWCYGTLQAMWKHRGAVVQGGRAGKLGRRGLGYLLVLQVLLPLFAPVVDLFAVYGLIFLDPVRIAGVWLGFLALQMVMAAYALALDRESMRALWVLPLQQFVYRQLMYLVVIQSVFTAIVGTRLRWHRMERYGSLRVPQSDHALASTPR